MNSYTLLLAMHGVLRNKLLTLLICAAVAIGVGGAISAFTLYHAVSADPIPWKSSQLFAVQIDNWGPAERKNGEPPDQLSYMDAAALLRARAAGAHQAAMYRTRATLMPADPQMMPARVSIRATHRDFFHMFDVPFRFGSAWSADDEEARANVVVLGSELAQQLFADRNPVGRSITLDGRDHVVTGVTQPWHPAPRFYDLGRNSMSSSEDLFIPFSSAVERQLPVSGNLSCKHPVDSAEDAWQGLLVSDCTWIQYWVELPTPVTVLQYRAFLQSYGAEQRRIGRFAWEPLVRLRNVREWLEYKEVVSADVRAMVAFSFGFLAVCLINAVGLILAKLVRQSRELAIRRALGASRQHIFRQCLAESAITGLAGGIAGLGLTLLGVSAARALIPPDLARVTQVDLYVVVFALTTAVLATTCAGLYPAWSVSRLQCAKYLRAQ